MNRTDYNRVETLGLPAGAQREGERCPACGEESKYRVCAECGTGAWIIDCGDYAQPRPIAAGRVDGSDLHHTYCDVCAIGEKMKVKKRGVSITKLPKLIDYNDTGPDVTRSKDGEPFNDFYTVSYRGRKYNVTYLWAKIWYIGRVGGDDQSSEAVARLTPISPGEDIYVGWVMDYAEVMIVHPKVYRTLREAQSASDVKMWRKSIHKYHWVHH